MKTIGITLARGGSKGVPRKNIRRIGGLPLLAYTIMEAKKSKHLDEYVVSTDSPEIAAVAREYGARVVMRPPHLAEDSTPTLPALIHAIEEVEAEDNIYFDVVADLRCTNPMKTVYDIDGAIEKLVFTHADAVIGVCEVQDGHPARLKQIFRDRLVDIWPEPESGNRQDLQPKVYIRNGSVYVVQRLALEEGVHIRLSDNVRPWIMPLERSINIDSEVDFKLAEVYLGN
jgi:CMP-N-acetylneuraminic acid synthetase